jgi:hypothetical protein
MKLYEALEKQLKTENNFVTEVAEKKVISSNATVGIYYWNKGS